MLLCPSKQFPIEIAKLSPSLSSSIFIYLYVISVCFSYLFLRFFKRREKKDENYKIARNPHSPKIHIPHKTKIMRHIIINVKYCLMFTRAHQIKFSLYFWLNYVMILYRHCRRHRFARCRRRRRRHRHHQMSKTYESSRIENDYETLTMTKTIAVAVCPTLCGFWFDLFDFCGSHND